MPNFAVLREARNTSKTQMPLVSIVIPTYNRSRHIKDAFRSAIEQDYDFCEIIICDNHSTDDTIMQIMSMANRLDNVTVLLWDTNVGPVANWLSGVEHCRGKYVKILFSDDELNKNCLSEMVASMSKDIGFVYSSCLVGESRKSSKLSYKDSKAKCVSPITYRASRGFCRYLLGKSMPVSPCAALFSKDHVLESLRSSIVDPPCKDALLLGAGPDIKIFFDALNKYPYYCHIPKPLLFFRCHSTSFTNSMNIQVRASYAKSISKYSKTFPLYARILRWITLMFCLPKELCKLIASYFIKLKGPVYYFRTLLLSNKS